MQRVAAALARLLPPGQAPRIRDVAPLPGGFANDNFRFSCDGEAFALRIARGAGGAEAAARFAAERRYLALAAAPDVVAFDASRGDMITRWIDGPSLAEAPRPAPATAARYLRDLHGAIPAGVRRYDPIAAAKADIAGVNDIAPAAVAALRRGWTPETLRGCHNDLNPWNVIRAGARWRTLDWELAGDNDPLFDAIGLAHGLGYDAGATDALLRAFCSAPPTPQRVRAARIAFLLREYAWARRQQGLGNECAEVRRQAEDAAQTLARLLDGA